MLRNGLFEVNCNVLEDIVFTFNKNHLIEVMRACSSRIKNAKFFPVSVSKFFPLPLLDWAQSCPVGFWPVI